MNKRILPAAALSLIAVAAFPVSAGDTYYRWIDESGTEVNSDRPPPAGVHYETVTGNTGRLHYPIPSEPAPATTAQTAPEPETPKPGNPTEPQFKKDPQQCELARKNLDALNTHARIRVPDGNGNYRYIGEEEKAQQRATAEAVIEQHCE